MKIIITVLGLGALAILVYAEGRKDEAKRHEANKAEGLLCLKLSCPNRVITLKEMAALAD